MKDIERSYMSFLKLSIVGFIAILLGVLIIVVITQLIPGWQERSQLGDMFGVVDSFFSGLAFIGLVYTIFIQHEEINKQMETVEKTNRLSSLTTLITIYSEDEIKYKGSDSKKSEHAKLIKEKLLQVIEREYLEKENLIKVN